MKLRRLLTALLLLAATALGHAADETPPRTFTHRISGLFQPDRVDDLREALKNHPKVKLLSIDFARAEATFSYDPKAFSTESLGELLGKKAFGIKPPSTTPADQLTLIEIPVIGLDCKGCSFGAYNVISKIDGVEQATASLKEGRVTALIDPTKTSRAALAEELKKAGLAVKAP